MLSTLTEEQNLITITPETSIRDAANLMIKHDIQQVPVVSPTDENKLLGFLTLNDITRQQNMMT